jgi:hypothetical protein
LPACLLRPFASTSLAQEIVAGENKMFAREADEGFAHPQLLRRNILDRLRAGHREAARKNQNTK